MAENERGPATPEEASRARRQLFIKGVAASAAVAVLVAVLVMMEGQHEPEPAPTARTVTSTGVNTPEEQSPSLAEATTRALRNSSEAAELQSVVMAEQQAVASAAAAAPVVPEESAEPLGVPAQASVPAAAPHRESAGRLVLEQSQPKSPRVAAASSSAAPAAAAPVKPPVAAARPAAPPSTTVPGDFFVQVGVFTNPGNAEELRSKLKAAGIPTQVETRVQVGPFASRQEALAAQARLKSLGMDSGMVVTGKH